LTDHIYLILRYDLYMTEVSQLRKQNQESIRQIQQEKAEKRKELSERAQQEMKELKAHYKNESQKLEKKTDAAILHIKKETEEINEEERAERFAKAMTYNRQAQVHSKSSHQNNRQSTNLKSESNTRQADFSEKTIEPENDSFFKVVDRGSEIKENSDGYIIKAYAPENEKDDIRLTLQNNKAILSGKRKFQDSIEDQNKKISTNNFQTFHEEFKFDRPIATTGMTRERDGDYMKFFIPKLENINFEEDV